MAAYWFTASTAFANPAVTIARSVSDTFAGIRPTDAPAFIAGAIRRRAGGDARDVAGCYRHELSKPDKLRWRMVVCARSQCSGQRRPSPGHRRTTCRQFSQRRSLVILVYPSPTVFAAFSVALLVSALLGPVAGRAIDRWGGRSVLIATNVIFAAGLIALSLADGAVGLFAAWIVLGIGMGSGLYEAAFSALVRLYGAAARSSITGITLIAGFASTVGWPLSTVLEAQFGWRGACLAWACIHLFLGVPLNALIAHTLRSPSRVHVKPVPEEKRDAAGPPVPRRSAILLAFIFASTWFISTAMAAHLPQLLQASGASWPLQWPPVLLSVRRR